MFKLKTSMIYSAITAVSLALLACGWSVGFAGGVHYLQADTVNIAVVQSGEFTQKVKGYGLLQSQNQRLITANSAAVVDEIKLRPGAVVSSDTVLLTLKNPTLETALQQANAMLHNSKTNKRKLALEQQRDILEQESRLAELKAETELALLQVDAQTSLAVSGVISGMELRKNELNAKQLKERYGLEQQKLQKLLQVHTEQLQLQDEAILQMEAELNAANYQLEQLEVRAGIAGVLQRLPVSLGQSINMGDELALVGSLTPLIAEVKVPQMQVSLLQHGAVADIDTRHGIVSGQVIRIDPVVADGAVQVDILLSGNLNTSIRPMQMVDASISGQSRGQTNFVDKPDRVSADTEFEVFKLDQTLQASKVKVQFGKVSGKRIEVISGLQPGDQIVLTDLAVDATVQRLQLLQ